MKFVVSRDVLSEAVQWTARAVPNRPAIPILAGVKINATDGVLELSSFDYEVSARGQVEAQVEENGETLVSGKLLADIAKALPNRDVSVTIDGAQTDIRCGNAAFTLATMPLDDYPQLPALPEKCGVIDAKELGRAITQVAIAASRDETLPLLTGVRLEIAGDKLTLLATDRYRLALKEVQWQPEDESFSATALVKSRVLLDVAKSLTSGGDIEISLLDDSKGGHSSIIGFNAGGRQATSSLMDGDYPPVRKLFPEDTPLEYICNRLELLEAVKRVSLVAERKTSVKLSFTDGSLTLEAGQGDNAQARESVMLLTESEEIKTAFNPQYLQDGLTVCESEYVRFGFTHPTKAAVMTGQDKPEGPTDESFRYLLMPIRFGV